MTKLRLVELLLKKIEDKLNKGRDKKVSGYEMAKIIGITSQQYYNYRQGKTKNANLSTLCKLKAISKMSWNEIGKYLEQEHGL